METAIAYILRRLKEEGRQDLIEEYHAQNRAYQRHIAIKAKENNIFKWKMQIAETEEGTAYYQRLLKNLERDEAALQKMIQGVENSITPCSAE